MSESMKGEFVNEDRESRGRLAFEPGRNDLVVVVRAVYPKVGDSAVQTGAGLPAGPVKQVGPPRKGPSSKQCAPVSR